MHSVISGMRVRFLGCPSCHSAVLRGRKVPDQIHALKFKRRLPTFTANVPTCILGHAHNASE
jgi:hypothetical protein